MTVTERIIDIQKRTGLSENIIRFLLKAETDSVINSLKKGEKATLIGRCTFTPVKKSKLDIGGNLNTCLRVSVKASTKIENILRETEDFENNEDQDIQLRELSEKESKLLLSQIKDLV